MSLVNLGWPSRPPWPGHWIWMRNGCCLQRWHTVVLECIFCVPPHPHTLSNSITGFVSNLFFFFFLILFCCVSCRNVRVFWLLLCLLIALLSNTDCRKLLSCKAGVIMHWLDTARVTHCLMEAVTQRKSRWRSLLNVWGWGWGGGTVPSHKAQGFWFRKNQKQRGEGLCSFCLTLNP